MKKIVINTLAILIIIISIAFGLLVGFGWAFVGGIEQILNGEFTPGIVKVFALSGLLGFSLPMLGIAVASKILDPDELFFH